MGGGEGLQPVGDVVLLLAAQVGSPVTEGGEAAVGSHQVGPGHLTQIIHHYNQVQEINGCFT